MRVVVSLTTVPWRVKNLDWVVKMIKEQTLQPAAIYIGLPVRCARDNTEYPEPSDYVKKNAIISRWSQDYGPVTKLLACMRDETDPDTIIISIDDDRTFPNETFKCLVQDSLNNPDAVICGQGHHIGNFPSYFALSARGGSFLEKIHDKRCNLIYHINKDGLVDVLFGTYSVVYRRKFFPDRHDDEGWKYFFSFYEIQPLRTNDDVWISAYLCLKNIPIKSAKDAEYIISNSHLKDDQRGLSSNWEQILKYILSIQAAYDLGAFRNRHSIPITSSITGVTILTLLGISSVVGATWALNHRKK